MVLFNYDIITRTNADQVRYFKNSVSCHSYSSRRNYFSTLEEYMKYPFQPSSYVIYKSIATALVFYLVVQYEFLLCYLIKKFWIIAHWANIVCSTLSTFKYDWFYLNSKNDLTLKCCPFIQMVYYVMSMIFHYKWFIKVHQLFTLLWYDSFNKVQAWPLCVSRLREPEAMWLAWWHSL